MKTKKGISLIVLVITIIVMIILAGAVILSLNNNGIFNKANEAVNATNLKQLEQVAQVAWGEAFLDDNVDMTDLSAVKTYIRSYLTKTGYTQAMLENYEITVTRNGVTVIENPYKPNDWDEAWGYDASTGTWSTKKTRGQTVTGDVIAKIYNIEGTVELYAGYTGAWDPETGDSILNYEETGKKVLVIEGNGAITVEDGENYPFWSHDEDAEGIILGPYSGGIVKVIIKEGITGMKEILLGTQYGIFEDYENLEEITLPTTITSICDYAFRNIKQGSTIHVPNQTIANLCAGKYTAANTTVVID